MFTLGSVKFLNQDNQNNKNHSKKALKTFTNFRIS